MATLDLTPRSRPAPHPLAWVTPGPLHQLTGGYLYDARIVEGLRAGGWPVGVLDIQAGRWPLDVAAGRRLINGVSRQPWESHSWGGVVVDELAHPALVAAILTGRLRSALRGAPLILLVHHLRCSEPAPWPQRALARLVEGVGVRAADLVVCTSETTAQTVRPLARRGVQVTVVRPGWDTHEDHSPQSGPGDLTPPALLSGAERGEQVRAMASQIDRPPAGLGTEHVLSGLPLSAPERGLGGEVSPAGRSGEVAPARRSGEVAPARRSGEVAPAGRSGEVALRLLLVGHWTPRKGILQALAALRQTWPGITLDLVGEQDRDPAYAARVRHALQAPGLAGRVRVHGRVSASELARRFADADALLMPSTHEGYGMVLAEALAAGLPIIATRVGAIPEVVRDGQEAALVPVNDIGELARAIEWLAVSPAEQRRRAALALERARALPTWTESGAAFERLLVDLKRTPQGG